MVKWSRLVEVVRGEAMVPLARSAICRWSRIVQNRVSHSKSALSFPGGSATISP